MSGSPRSLAPLLAALLTVAACGGGDGDTATSATAGSSATTAATVVETTTPSTAALPVTVTHDGSELELTERPELIVSLSASLTGIAYAVGAGDQVVALRHPTPEEAPDARTRT